MSFLDSVKGNKPGIGGGVNPFVGGTTMNKKATDNPFAPKPATAPATPAFNPVTGVGVPGAPGMAKPGVPSRPGVPAGMGAPKAPGMPKPAAPTPAAPKAEEKVEVAATTETKEVSTENLVKDIKETKVEVPAPVKEETKVEAKTEDGQADTKVEEKVEAKTETKPKTNSRSRNKAKTTAAKKEDTKTATDTPVDSIEEAEVIENLFKMPNTSIKYAEAVKAVKSKFVDEEWEAFRAETIKESDEIVIEQDMQEGAVKKTIAKLNALREKIWVSFVDTKSLYESLSSKETEGVIERVKFASLEGTNETSRKKAGILAVMNYQTEDGEIINLYELYDETRSRFYFLKNLMDTIQYKSNVLITYQSAIKVQKNVA